MVGALIITNYQLQ